jgi:hypothetical protein
MAANAETEIRRTIPTIAQARLESIANLLICSKIKVYTHPESLPSSALRNTSFPST